MSSKHVSHILSLKQRSQFFLQFLEIFMNLMPIVDILGAESFFNLKGMELEMMGDI